MKKTIRIIRFAHLLILCQLSLSIKGQNPQPFLSDSIHSDILHETRELRIILPKEYEPGSHNKYEVLYILDGEWYQELVPFTYNFAESAGYLPESIFVLIRNRYRQGRNLRDRDFSPTHVPYDSISGGANNFYDFLTKEVVPFVENKYPSNGKRSLLGSSYSGLFTVYAFLKDPLFFQSYIASDPNINFDKHYVTHLASQKLPLLAGTPGTPGTLFIAGRTQYYREGGVSGFDSVLKVLSPGNLHWQCVRYENETHYSVQLKAFYEGLRFSHFGYSSVPPEFHPRNGMVSANKSFSIYFLNNNPSARYSINGLEPTNISPLMIRDDTVSVSAPCLVRVKTFANRSSYTKEWEGSFITGRLLPERINNKLKKGFSYRVYNGSWDSIPDINSLKETKSAADSIMKVNPLLHQRSGLLLLEGALEISEDAEYIFYVNGFDAVQLILGGRIFFKDDGSSRYPAQSYIVSLKKGRYPLRLELLHKTENLDSHFSVYKSVDGNKKWWENQIMDF